MVSNAKIWLSIPTNLKEDIKEVAEKIGLSLNEFATSCLFSQVMAIKLAGLENLSLRPVTSEKYKRIVLNSSEREVKS